MLFIGAAVISEMARSQRPDVPDPVRGVLGPDDPDTEAYIMRKHEALAALASKDPDQTVATLISFNALVDTTELTRSLYVGDVKAIFYELNGKPGAYTVDEDIEAALAEATGVSNCRCIYGAVVSGATLKDVAGLVGKANIRLVDITEPPTSDLRLIELRPIIPT